MAGQRYELVPTDREDGVFRVKRPGGDRFDRSQIERVGFTGEVTWLWENRIPLGNVIAAEREKRANLWRKTSPMKESRRILKFRELTYDVIYDVIYEGPNFIYGAGGHL